jgi:hypothetical protein
MGIRRGRNKSPVGGLTIPNTCSTGTFCQRRCASECCSSSAGILTGAQTSEQKLSAMCGMRTRLGTASHPRLGARAGKFRANYALHGGRSGRWHRSPRPYEWPTSARTSRVTSACRVLLVKLTSRGPIGSDPEWVPPKGSADASCKGRSPGSPSGFPIIVKSRNTVIRTPSAAADSSWGQPRDVGVRTCRGNLPERSSESADQAGLQSQAELVQLGSYPPSGLPSVR